jgi:hypothetical protein
MPALDNRYELLRPLGQGGMATVYLVRHLGLQSLHALKVLDPAFARSAEARERFLTEGRIQAKLRHPHIVQVTDIVVSPVAGLIMDYVEGHTLGDYCRKRPHGRLEPALLREVFLPVLEAMEEAHRQGVVHRDLNPDNILVGEGHGGRLHPRVTDFGIAKVLEAELSAGKGRTQAGARMGTLRYMSPEQIRGAAEVDARTDVFALGALLYEVATGRVAFETGTDFEVMKRITEGVYEPPERVVEGLPTGLVACIRKALAVEPAERFQDCGAFRTALQEALEEPRAPAPVPPAVPAPPAVPVPPRSSRGGYVAAIVVLLLAVAGLAGSLLETRQQAYQWRQASQALEVDREQGTQEVQRLRQRLAQAEREAQQARKSTSDLRAEREQLAEELDQAQSEAQELRDRYSQLMPGDLVLHGVAGICNMTPREITYHRIPDNSSGDAGLVSGELASEACDVQPATGLDVIVR